MPMISGEAPFMRLLGITRCARGLGDFYLSACDRSRDVKIKPFLKCEPDITVISTNPIRISKFSNVRRQLSNEKRRDVATATAKLLGSVMDIGGGGFEGEKEEDEENVVPIVFSNATDSEFETLGLKKSGKEGEGIRAPILLPSPKKKEKSENLVQRFREFSTTKDVLNVRGVRARSARISICSLFHVSIMLLKLQEYPSYRSLIPQESHSKINARVHTRL